MTAIDPAFLPRGMYRNRKLLDLAHEFGKCMNCGRVTPQGCEPAHSNLPEHGKGMGEKSHDCFFAALCYLCHRWLDNSLGYGKDPSGRYEHSDDGKRSMFVRAMHHTWLLLCLAGKMKVA